MINALDTVAAYENAIVILRLPLVPVPDTAVAGMMNYRVSQENVVIVGVCHQSIEVIIFSLHVLKTQPKSQSVNDADSFDDCQPFLLKLGNR